MTALRILHVIRAPVGGLFRHVRDLAVEQAARGHDVALIADSNSADGLTQRRLDELRPHLRLGLHLAPMSRNPGLVDFAAVHHTKALVGQLGAHVVHGHGAKGGAYARLGATLARGAGASRAVRFYTPHGGSLHYRNQPLKGGLYRGLEKVLGAMTDGVIFESGFASDAYSASVRPGKLPMRVVPNGVTDAEFDTVHTRFDAAAFVFVGELRLLKGVDLLLGALARLNQKQPVRAVIVGDGPDASHFKTLAHDLGLSQRVTFTGAMPAREAFARGRCLVMPSRAESLPYVALEAAAAGLPLIAANVGGVNEIVRGSNTTLVAPDNVEALESHMANFLDDQAGAFARARKLRTIVGQRFRVSVMAHDIENFYFDALARQEQFAAVPQLAS